MACTGSYRTTGKVPEITAIQRDLRRIHDARQTMLNRPRKFTTQDSRWNAGRTRCWPYVTVYWNSRTDEIYLSLLSPGLPVWLKHSITDQKQHALELAENIIA